MMSGETMGFVMHVVEFMAVLFVFAIGLLVAAIIVIYILDRTQTKHAIRRNYPPRSRRAKNPGWRNSGRLETCPSYLEG